MVQDSNFLYHQASLHLLNEKAAISLEATMILQNLERERGFVLPVSVKEWYALEHAEDLLSRYPPAGTVRSVKQLGSIESSWANGSPQQIDLLKQSLLLFMTEEQGNCYWAMQLNGEDDPPVVVSLEGVKPAASWKLCSETFSRFVYACIWDSLVINPDDQMFGWKKGLLQTELDYLHEYFQEDVRTYTFPGEVNYRFFGDGQRILVQETKGWASWYFAAESDARLKRLIEHILQCETLKRDLCLERNGATGWENMFLDE